MSVTLNDSVEFMISRRLSLEQCYGEIMMWPEDVQEEGKKILHEKMKEGRFDKAIKYHHISFVNPKNPKLYIKPESKIINNAKIHIPWYKRIFKKK